MGQYDTTDLRADVITLLAVLVIVGAGAGLFFRGSPVLTVGMVAGLVAGIGCSRWWRAPIVAALGVPGGFLITSLVARPVWHAGLFWLPDALETAGVAAMVGGVACVAIRQSPRLRPLLTGVAVLAIVFSMWTSGLALAAQRSADGVIPLEKLGTVPTISANSTDEDIFLTYVSRMRAGEAYYPMAVDVFQAMHASAPDRPSIAGSPLSYRLPTLYWLFSRLPDSSGLLVDVMLLMCSVGVVSAFVLARQWVEPVPAVVGTSLVASVFAGYTGPMLVYAEPWAGILALVVATLIALARDNNRRAFALHVGAAACALFAASIRELGIAFILLGLAAALADRRDSRSRLWVPWAVALVAFAAILGAHWSAASHAFAGIAAATTGGARWLHADGSGLVSAVSLAATHAWLASSAVWALVVLGMVGSLVGPKDRASRVVLAGVALCGPLVLLLVRPPGWSSYGAPGYWGDLVIPATLACVPLALARVRGIRREPVAAD